MQALPHAKGVPVAQASPAGHPAATVHLLRQVFPGDAGLEHEEDAAQARPILHWRATALGMRFCRRQYGLDLCPQFIRDERLGHASSVTITSTLSAQAAIGGTVVLLEVLSCFKIYL